MIWLVEEFSFRKMPNTMTKKRGLLFLYLLLVTFLPAQSNSKGASADAGPFIQRFEGAIAGKHPILMNIIYWGDGEISGWYYYERSGRRIELQGEVDEYNRFELREYAERDHTGTFTGLFTGPTHLEGLWIDPANNKELSFSVSALKNGPDEQGWTGDWYLNDAWDGGRLIIGNVSRDSFDFALFVLRSGHLGQVTGTAAFDGATAVFADQLYSQTPCRLTFEHGNTFVQITQQTGAMACGFGMRAHANGRFEAEARIIEPEIAYGEKGDLFETEEQRDAFRRLLGAWYANVAFNMQGVRPQEVAPEDARDLTAVEGAAMGFIGTHQAIVLHRDHEEYWILTLGFEEGQSVLHYLTNVETDLNQLPHTLEEWREPFQGFPLRRYLLEGE